MERLALLNPEGLTESEVAQLPKRNAVRAVMLNREGNLALIYAKTYNYYKLPGGGVEGSESHAITLNRECEEEVGCSAELLEPIGYVEEWRRIFNEHQISYAYSAQQLGQQKPQNLMEDEARDGFEVCWVNPNEALRLLSNIQTEYPLARDYMMPRDKYILQAYLAKISK